MFGLDLCGSSSERQGSCGLGGVFVAPTFAQVSALPLPRITRRLFPFRTV